MNTPPLLLLVALLLEAWLPLPDRWKPSALLPIFKLLLRRVFNPQQPVSQQRIAGFLFPWVILLPVTLTVWIFRSLAPWPYWFDLVVLMWCVESQPIRHTLHSIQQLLTAQKRSMARLQLAPWVLRETGNLSEMGICKAAIEMSILRWLSQWWAPAIAFVLFGIYGAIWVRLLQLIAASCNMKLSTNRLCGELSARLLQTFLFLPALLAVLLSAFHPRAMRNLVPVFRHIGAWPALGSGLLLNLLGHTFNLSLGGPRYYQGLVYRYSRLGGPMDPGSSHLFSAYRWLMLIGWGWWIILAAWCGWLLYV